MDSSSLPNSRVPHELVARLRAELDQDEQLLWVGQPLPGRFKRQALPIVLLGIPVSAFIFCWLIAVLEGPPGMGGLMKLLFLLCGVPFALMALGMLFSPYWFSWQATHTCYAVTDRRAITWQAGLFGKTTIRSYAPAALAKICRREYADGSGDLVFEEVTPHPGEFPFRTTTRRGFIAIAQAREVESLLRKTLLSQSDRAADTDTLPR